MSIDKVFYYLIRIIKLVIIKPIKKKEKENPKRT